MERFEIESFVKGYHVYRQAWTPIISERLTAVQEPTNLVDKYAVCILKNGHVVGHLEKGQTGKLAKTMFYFLRADDQCSCVVVIRGKPVNLGGREGMSVPCILEFSGKKDFIDVLKSQISKS